MIISILTLFPEFFKTTLSTSILKRAVEKELVIFNIVNIRDFAQDKHKVTDDHPYGGGAGMVMKIEPIALALEKVKKDYPQEPRKVVLTSAKGDHFDQPKAVSYSKVEHLIFICGHYQGVDERVAEHLVDEEVRIGDFVLTGGEPATLVMVDAVTRLIPQVLGNEESLHLESHAEPGMLGYPHYTRPVDFNGWLVPEVLLSGNHQLIDKWRQNRITKDKK